MRNPLFGFVLLLVGLCVTFFGAISNFFNIFAMLATLVAVRDPKSPERAVYSGMLVGLQHPWVGWICAVIFVSIILFLMYMVQQQWEHRSKQVVNLQGGEAFEKRLLREGAESTKRTTDYHKQTDVAGLESRINAMTTERDSARSAQADLIAKLNSLHAENERLKKAMPPRATAPFLGPPDTASLTPRTPLLDSMGPIVAANAAHESIVRIEAEEILRASQATPAEIPKAKPAEVDATRSSAEKWEQIAPLVETYRTTKDLAARLDLLADSWAARWEDRKKGLSVHEALAQAMRGHEAYAKEFDEGFRQELVRAVTNLRSQYGLMDPSLTDGNLASQVNGEHVLRGMVGGLDSMVAELSKMITAKAASQ